VIGSYNWGEHRVVDKLEHVPKGIPDEALEGIPKDPDKRNYWRFLEKYSDWMAKQTKDYVLKVFSSAVVGRNPEQFGVDLQNPLRKHLNVSSGPVARRTVLRSGGERPHFAPRNKQVEPMSGSKNC
jgi:membrane-bound lytic murein transglycosylase D